MRLFGREIRDNKNIIYGLADIKGIGLTRAKYIVQELSIDSNIKMKDLSSNVVNQITEYIEKNFLVEIELVKEITNNIRTKIDQRSYTGIRLKSGLPIHGQRTKSNSKTSRRMKP